MPGSAASACAGASSALRARSAFAIDARVPKPGIAWPSGPRANCCAHGLTQAALAASGCAGASPARRSSSAFASGVPAPGEVRPCDLTPTSWANASWKLMLPGSAASSRSAEPGALPICAAARATLARDVGGMGRSVKMRPFFQGTSAKPCSMVSRARFCTEMGGFAKGARMGTEGPHPFLRAPFAEFPQ